MMKYFIVSLLMISTNCYSTETCKTDILGVTTCKENNKTVSKSRTNIHGVTMTVRDKIITTCSTDTLGATKCNSKQKVR